MFQRAIETYRKINSPGTPEDSVLLRTLIFATVMTGAAGILSQGYFSLSLDILIIGGLIIGYYYSYTKRADNNLVVKVILTLGLFVMMFVYLYDVANTYYDPRIPLAKLFLLLQVSHSFDLPRRRDLEFSLFFSLITIGLGAVLASNMTYLLFALLYGIFYLPSLLLLYVSELKIQVESFLAQLKPKALPRMLIWLSLATAVITMLLFVFLPRVPVQSKYTFPVKAPAQLNLANPNQFSNPLYPQSGGGVTPNCDPASDPTCTQAEYDWKQPPKVNPDSYYGFNSYMDLRSRGILSESLVMRVKTIYPSLYRGVIFDKYNGLGWEITDKDPRRITLRYQPFIVPFISDDLTHPNRTEVITTFIVEAESSNSIFVPYRAQEIYFPSDIMFVDNNLGLRAPFYLDKSVTYTSISQVDKPDLAAIAAIDKKVPKFVDRYLELPEDFPARVRDLAQKITKDARTPYQKVAALDEYLRNTYPYDLDIPPQNKEMDAVEYFLFEQKRGYCEMFASSLATMARSVGIPARVVTGYRPGEYNPFTGAYEIRAIDAHAWVDAYMPGYGWVEFDPTPSFGVPQIEKRYFVYKDTLDFFKQKIEAVAAFAGLGDRKDKSDTGSKSKADTINSAARSLPLIIVLILVAIFVFIFRKKLGSLIKKRPPKPDYYKRMLQKLDKAGYIKEQAETPDEFLSRIAPQIGEPEAAAIVDKLTQIYDEEAFDNKQISSKQETDELLMALELKLNDEKRTNKTSTS